MGGGSSMGGNQGERLSIRRILDAGGSGGGIQAEQD